MLLTPLCVLAQEKVETDALPLSIEEALRLAEAASEDVEIARAGVLEAEAQKDRATSQLYPQVGGSLSYNRTIFSEFDVLREVTPAPEAGDVGSLFEDLPFGRRNNWSAGLALSQNLYTGGRISAQRRLAEAGFASAKVSAHAARASAVLLAAQAYYDAVLTERLVEIAEATFAQAEKTFEQVRTGESVGARPEFDVLRARVALENQRPAVLQRRIERDLAHLRLRQVLELPADRRIRLTTSLSEAPAGMLVKVAREIAEVPEDAETPRPPVLLAREAVVASEASVEVARSQRWPSLAFTSQFGLVNYPEAPLPDFSEWRRNWTVGLSLQVPIFTGFRIGADVAVARAQAMQAKAQLDQLDELTRLDTLSARKQLEAAELVWEATGSSVAQAEQAYEIAELRYREGISTQLELDDTRLALQQARATRALAARDLQISRIRVALLPRLPLSQSGTPRGQDALFPQQRPTTQPLPLGVAPQTRSPGPAASQTGATPPTF